MNITLVYESTNYKFDLTPSRTILYIKDLACRLFNLKKTSTELVYHNKTISKTQPNMQMNDLLNLEVPAFDRDKQDKIVQLLGNIDKKIELWGFYVNEENRDKGVGKALFHYAEKVARRYGNRIEIQWFSPTPKWTYEWYLREGYTEFEFDEGYSKLYKIV